MTRLPFSFLPLMLLSVCVTKGADDILIADFEGGHYGTWKAAGDAFGGGPAEGALPGQMLVEGFAGKGLVNSFHGGDQSTGKLISPEIKIERKFVNFLIGGGGFPGETCINLLSDGKIVRTATGANLVSGGSERLDWQSWDVSDLLGQLVSLEIVDDRKGTWGHINVDQIGQSDTPAVIHVDKEFTIDKRYLIWPVSVDTKQKERFFFTLDGDDEPLCYYDICLSDHPDFWVFTDLANFQGRKITVTGKIPGNLDQAWERVSMSDTYPGEDQIYQESLRPQYHYTSRRGWLNDPNGLVWNDGEWHLFYQHNPYNHGWDNMTWGHAVSVDLYHWEERPPALFPNVEGYMYSGSAVVAPKERVGFPIQGDNALVLAYTASGRFSYVPGLEAVQGIASSDDNGKTFDKFAGNPVIPHVRAENRDPKVQWHEPSQRWILNLYYDGSDYGIYTSPDLVKWEKTCDYRIPGEGECPDMFALPLDGNPKDVHWIVWGANGKYMIGDFDGREFTPSSGPHRHYFGSAYAGQTYDNAPDGRRVHIGWMRAGGVGLEGMPFNMQMTLPMDFTLRSSATGPRLWVEPSREVATLRETTKQWTNLTVSPSDPDPLAEMDSGQFEIEAVIDGDSDATEMGFQVFGDSRAIWKKSDGTFTGAEGPQAAEDGKVHIRLFVDSVSMEVFVNGTYVSQYLRQTPGTKPVQIVAVGGAVRFESLTYHKLRSVWQKRD